MNIRPRQVWGAGVLAACLALAGIVVVAAEGRPLEGPPSSSRLQVGDWWRDALVAGFFLALLGGAVLVVWAMLGPRRASTVQPRRKRRRWWMTALGLVALFVVVNALRPILGDGEADDTTTAPVAAAESSGDAADPPPPWAVIALAGIGGAALAAAIVAGRRLRDSAPPEPPIEPGALLVALDASIEDLEREGDPRAAVIAAYARLLEGFERAGMGRRPAETPLEHLRRGLAALPLRPEPAERLTRLFLEARFSVHPIGAAERDEAHAALVTARHDLAAVAP